MRRLAMTLCFAGLVACDGDIRLTSGDGGGAPAQGAADGGTVTSTPGVGCAADGGACTYGTCDTVSGRCVECTADGQCNSNRPRCDLTIGRCVSCVRDADCTSGQKCEPSTRTCVAGCSGGAACPSEASMCDGARGICVACTSAGGGCAVDRFCDVGGRCSECASDAQCTGETKRCDPLSGVCVVCLTSSDCPATAPLCEPSTLECRVR